MMIDRKPGHFAGATLAAALTLTAPATNAAWELQPQVSLGSRFDSNPRLTRTESLEDDATGYFADAYLRSNWKYERTTVSLQPRYRYGVYPESDQEDLEDRDFFLDLSAQHRTPRHTLTFDGRFSEVGIRRNDIAGTNESGDIVFATEDQVRWSGAPSWEFQLSERFLVSLTGLYEEVEYDNDAGVEVLNRFDYDFAQTELTFFRVLNDKSRIGIAGNASRYDGEGRQRVELGLTADAATTSDSIGASVVYIRALAPTLSATVRGGWAQTEVETDSVGLLPGTLFFVPVTRESDSSNLTGLVSLEKVAERTNYTLTLSRRISPNSNGGEVVSDRLNAQMRHRLTERINLRVGGTAFQQEDVVEDQFGQGLKREQDFIQAFIEAGWRITRELTLNVEYRFTDVQDINLSGVKTDADNHRASIRLVYRPTPWRN